MLKSIFISSFLAIISNRPHLSQCTLSLSLSNWPPHTSKQRSRRLSVVEWLKTGKESWRRKRYCINKFPPHLYDRAIFYFSPNESKSFPTARRMLWWHVHRLSIRFSKDSVIFVWSRSEINHFAITEEREEKGIWRLGRSCLYTALFESRGSRKECWKKVQSANIWRILGLRLRGEIPRRSGFEFPVCY